MIACSQEKPPKIFDYTTSVVFQSHCYLIGMRFQKGCNSIMLLIISSIPHTAQAHWAISQKIDPLMCLTIDQSFYSMSYHNLFKNFSKKRENKTSIVWTWFDRTSCTTLLSMLKTISLKGTLYTTKSISEQP